jgi:hypothetical protein
MFHFPTFPPHALCVQAGVTPHDGCRVSPFGNPRITARLTAPRGLSQPPTSFIGSWCQGIHRAPLITWPQRCSRPLCSSQATTGTGPNPAAAPPHPGTPRHQDTRAVRRRTGPPEETRTPETPTTATPGHTPAGRPQQTLGKPRGSLRTQQRVRHHPTGNRPVPPRTGPERPTREY